MSSRFRHQPPSRNASRGVGLIEVLISILVLAIGLLGIAALQATTLRNSQGALERSQATIQTYGILDSMRANVAATRAGAYDMAMTCVAPATPATLAQRDIANWIGQAAPATGLKQQLGPNACGSIACVPDAIIVGTTNATCTIVVQWDTERGSAALPQSLTTVSRL